MTSPTGDIRPLNFPLNRSADLESETPNDPSVTFLSLDDWNTEDPDERVDIVLNLSLNEYVALATCVDVGRDIAYGDNSLYLWWVWTRSLFSMSICDSIIACINDPESGVSDAIYDLLGGGSYQPSRDYGQSQNDLDLSSSLNPTCDKDILFGQVVQLVDYLDQLNTDFFEILEVASNTTEFLAEVVGDITFIDESSLDAAISWIAFIQDSIAENYAAQVTQSYKDDLACEIFCLAQTACEVTPRLLYDLFKDRLSSSISLEGVIWDTLDFLAGGSWSGSQIADFMFYGQLALRSQLGKYFEKFAYQDIETRLSIYSNDPNPDWELLCDTCCEDSEDFDFLTDAYETVWFPRNTIANVIWVNGVGWTGENPGGTQIASASWATITNVTATYDVTGGSGDRARIFQFASSTGTLGALIGTLPFTGNVDIGEDILVVIDATSGTWNSALETLHIEGCKH